MRLILMRHAKSDWYSGAADDFSRPLSERGVHDARAMGRWLAASDYLPEQVLCSPARRTRDTLELVAAGAATDLAARTTWVEALYHSSAETIAEALAEHARAGAVMVLGHNPGLEDFLCWLVPQGGLPAGFSKLFPTGSVYVLNSDAAPDRLSGGCAVVAAHQRPKLLDR